MFLFPQISIVTPSYNQGNFIEETIKSVLEQGYPNLEYLIFDGASSDNTVDILAKYDQFIDYWVSEKDDGQSAAINAGLSMATGDIVTWLNSDDYYLPGTLNKIAQAWIAYPDAGLYIGTGPQIDEHGNFLHRHSTSVGFSFESMLLGQCYLSQPSVFINKKAIDSVGLLDESLHFAMDLEYWLRIGKHYDAVVMDEDLAAYRVYENCKTFAGLKSWVVEREVIKRYLPPDQDISPGLLLNFLLVLMRQEAWKYLDIDIQQEVEILYGKVYQETNKRLGLVDNIPVGKGIQFVPDPHFVISAGRTSLPFDGVKVDVVIQATGSHAWAVGEGWGNVARKLGLLNRIFRPVAEWGDLDVRDDDHLGGYLENTCTADLILLAGFDWHSQMLHVNEIWRHRWQNSSSRKILYIQESIVSSSKLTGSDEFKRMFMSAATIADAVIYTDILDADLVCETGLPSMWLPFGVDLAVFHEKTNFYDRINKAFFRGKIEPFTNDNEYSERRMLLDHLLERDLIDHLAYTKEHVSVHDLCNDFNKYCIAVNFPSVFANHPTRVTESMACGCAVVTNKLQMPEVDGIFSHGRDIIYYENEKELASAVRFLQENQGVASEIAANSIKTIQNKLSLASQLQKIVEWATEIFPELNMRGEG